MRTIYKNATGYGLALFETSVRKLENLFRLDRYIKVLILAIAAMSFSTMDTYASHFRYGNISWRQIDANTVEFQVAMVFRSSYFGGLPIGQTFTPDLTFFHGDGTNRSIQLTVTSRSPSEDWSYAEGTFTKTYGNPNGVYTAYFASCCRIGTLINNSNADYRVETQINLGTGNTSPVSTLPPIINLATGASNATFVIPASDPNGDELSFSLTPIAQMGPGSINPTGFSVDANTGIATFNTIGKSVGQLYNASVTINDNNGARIAVDFLMRIVVGSDPPVFGAPTPPSGTVFPVYVGKELSFDIKAQDPDPTDVVTLQVVGLPATATMTPTLPTSGGVGMPVESSFSWTPTSTGTFIINYTVEDNNGAQATSSVTIVVSEEVLPIPTIMNVTLSEEEIQVGEELCLEVTVLDQFGLPIVGADVTLDVNGVFYGTGITDVNGRLDFCITPDEAGMLVFEINLDDLQETASILVTSESSDDIAIKAFALVDADKNQVIREIKEGDELLYSEIKDLSLSIAAITDPEVVGSVWIEMESTTKCETCPAGKTGRTENVVPYSLFADINGNYNGRQFSPGLYKLTGIPYSSSNRQGEMGTNLMVNFTIKYDVEISTFVLVDAHTDHDIQLIKDGDVLDLAKLGDLKFNIRGEASSSPIGGMFMKLEGPFDVSIYERVAPYALFGDKNGDYAGRKLPTGKYTLSAKAFPQPFADNSGFGGETATISFEVISGMAVTSYTLVNADSNEDIMDLNDGDVVDLNKYGNVSLSIRANTVGDHIHNVVMMMSGPIHKTIRERFVPYALFGDLPANEYSGKHFPPGDYELTSTPYGSNNEIGGAKTIRFKAEYVEEENLRLSFAGQIMEERKGEESESIAGGSLSIYPQPSNGLVNFKYPSELPENTSLQIIDSNGRIIYGGFIGQTPAFDFRNYGSGLYLLIINTNSEILKHKIIIH